MAKLPLGLRRVILIGSLLAAAAACTPDAQGLAADDASGGGSSQPNGSGSDSSGDASSSATGSSGESGSNGATDASGGSTGSSASGGDAGGSIGSGSGSGSGSSSPSGASSSSDASTSDGAGNDSSLGDDSSVGSDSGASNDGTSSSGNDAPSDSVATGDTAVDASPLSFATDVYPIITQRCIACHTPGGGGVTNGHLDMTTNLATGAYGRLMMRAMGTVAGGAATACAMSGLFRVVPGSAAISLLYNKVNSKVMGMPALCGNPMPNPTSAPPLTSAEVTTIGNWIDQGANP